MAEIKHRPGCDRPTGPVGTEAACSCAMYQGQFPPPDGYEGPVPTEHERAWATQVARSTAGVHGSPREHIAEALARHREELLAPIREALDAADHDDLIDSDETLRRIREIIGG